MPAPAHRCARLPVEHARADRDRELAVAVEIEPADRRRRTSRARPARASAIQSRRDSRRRAADRGRRVQRGGELEHVARRAQPGAESGCGGGATWRSARTSGASGASSSARVGERGADRLDHQLVLAAILVARDQLGAGLGDRSGRGPRPRRRRACRRRSPAARRADAARAGERVAPHQIAVAPDQPLRGRRDQRAGARRLDQHPRAVGVALIERGEQIGGAHRPGQRDRAGPGRDDLRARAAGDRVGDRDDLGAPLLGARALQLDQRGLRRGPRRGRPEGCEVACQLVVPAPRRGGVLAVDREHQLGARAVRGVGPARQEEPRVAEPGPRRAVGRAGRERRAADQPRPRDPERRHRRGRAGDHRARDVESARAAHDLVPAVVTGPAQLARACRRPPGSARPTLHATRG